MLGDMQSIMGSCKESDECALTVDNVLWFLITRHWKNSSVTRRTYNAVLTASKHGFGRDARVFVDDDGVRGVD